MSALRVMFIAAVSFPSAASLLVKALPPSVWTVLSGSLSLLMEMVTINLHASYVNCELSRGYRVVYYKPPFRHNNQSNSNNDDNGHFCSAVSH